MVVVKRNSQLKKKAQFIPIIIMIMIASPRLVTPSRHSCFTHSFSSLFAAEKTKSKTYSSPSFCDRPAHRDGSSCVSRAVPTGASPPSP